MPVIPAVAADHVLKTTGLESPASSLIKLVSCVFNHALADVSKVTELNQLLLFADLSTET